MPKRVAHLSSKHRWDDIRIFRKEAVTLAAHGYEVTYVAPAERSSTAGGVRIEAVPLPKSRRARMLGTVWRVYRAALRLDTDLYHFHDPELIPVGLLLKLRGKCVVYDVHEDLPRQILSKHWIRPWLRTAVAWGAEVMEWAAARLLDAVVAATPTIAARFPARRTALVQNFPILDELLSGSAMPYAERPPHFAYVGGISAIRSAREMVEAMALLEPARGAKLVMAGSFEPPALRQALERLPGWASVEFRGWQTREQVAGLLAEARAGLVIFYPEPNHTRAQPNKLFEYLSTGLPVIASDFPLWRELIAGEACGLLVDPRDPAAIAAAMRQLLDDPAAAAAMGERGQRAVRQRYSWASQAEALLALYERLF